MARRFAALSLAGLALAMPQRGESQQFREWNNLCAPGVITACASLTLTLHYNAALYGGGGGTEATATIANLQGSDAWVPDVGPYQLRSFSFSGLSADPGSAALDPSYCQSVSGLCSWNTPATGGAELFWLDTYIIYALSGSSLSMVGQNGSGLWGCDVSTVHPFHSYRTQTCGDQKTWTRVMPGQVAFTADATMSFSGWYFEDYSGSGGVPGFSCTAGVDCLSSTVVPEPETWFLLGTGLFGLGFVARRRREVDKIG